MKKQNMNNGTKMEAKKRGEEMNKYQVANSKFFYLFLLGMLGNSIMLMINSCVRTIPHVITLPLLFLCVAMMLVGMTLAYKDMKKKEEADHAK